jgi:hypothetical protein
MHFPAPPLTGFRVSVLIVEEVRRVVLSMPRPSRDRILDGTETEPRLVVELELIERGVDESLIGVDENLGLSNVDTREDCLVHVILVEEVPAHRGDIWPPDFEPVGGSLLRIGSVRVNHRLPHTPELTVVRSHH